ncbi:MAG: hypothetical protein ACTS2F_06165 [Thainema sp.]
MTLAASNNPSRLPDRISPLEVVSVFKASQAISSIIQLEEWLRQLSQIMLQQSG